MQVGRFHLVDETLCAGLRAVPDPGPGRDGVLPFAARLDRMGFAAVTVMDATLFEHLARTGREHPWSRMATLAAALRRTPANVWIRGRCGFGRDPLSPRLMGRFLEDLAVAGIDCISVYEPLNDLSRLRTTVSRIRSLGLRPVAGLLHGTAPPFTEPYFARRAAGLLEAGAERVCLLDCAGSLTPDRARALVPALHRAVGAERLDLWLSAASGLAERVAVEAVLSGSVFALHAVSEPLAGARSLPPHQYLAASLGRMGHRCQVGQDELSLFEDYISGLAESQGWECPRHVLHDPDRAAFELGEEDLAGASAAVVPADRAAVLKEVQTLRATLGWPPMAEPLRTALVQQALCNRVAPVAGEPELVHEVAILARGGYGTTPARKDRTMVRVARDRGASTPSHCLDAAADGANCAEERWLRRFVAVPPDAAPPAPEPTPGRVPLRADTPLALLVCSLQHRHPVIRTLRIRKGGFVFQLGADGAQEAGGQQVDPTTAGREPR